MAETRAGCQRRRRGRRHNLRHSLQVRHTGRALFVLLLGDGYAFHSPISGTVSGIDSVQHELQVEAKPRGMGEMRLCDAWMTIESFESRHEEFLAQAADHPVARLLCDLPSRVPMTPDRGDRSCHRWSTQWQAWADEDNGNDDEFDDGAYDDEEV